MPTPNRDELTAEETDFITARDSFYMATVTEDGWPYIQHRGGPKGFLKVLGQNQLGFDWNCSQYISPRYTNEEFQAFETDGRIR